MQKLLQDMIIGNNIKLIRKRNKFTQVQLIMRMHDYGSLISETTLIKIEGGYRNIRISDLVIMKTIFNVRFDEFFIGLSVQING